MYSLENSVNLVKKKKVTSSLLIISRCVCSYIVNFIQILFFLVTPLQHLPADLKKLKLGQKQGTPDIQPCCLHAGKAFILFK